MGRPLRVEFPGAVYHITSRGNERKSIFRDDTDRLNFVRILEDYNDRYGILIHSYVLMDNHYHVILETPKGNLLKVMHGINSGYTGYFNRNYHRSGHLFQGRYKAILVEKDVYLVELSRYVHLNPVRAKMVNKPEEYVWSSYRSYIGKVKKNKWIEYSWILSKFGKYMKKAMGKYKEYTEEGLSKKIKSPLTDIWGQSVLGSEKFREKIGRILKGKVMSDEIQERKRFMKNPPPDDIIKVVVNTFDINEEGIKKKGKRENTARLVAIYLAQRYSGLRNEEIGKLFGGIHKSAVSKASMRLKEMMSKDRKLLKQVSIINSTFKT